MDIPTLRRLVSLLPEDTPILAATLEAHVEGAERTTWYRSQKEHMEGWLREYGGPGAYGRKGGEGRDAKYFYNHFQCAPGLFWLAEAAGVSPSKLQAAVAAVDAVGSNYARQCAALRREIPWSNVEQKLLENFRIG